MRMKIAATLSVVAFAFTGTAVAGNPTFPQHGSVSAARKACENSGGTWIPFKQICQ
jgi:hypothetical protein